MAVTDWLEPCLSSVKVEPLMVVGSIASEKVASTLAVSVTSVVPSAGATPLTVGATVSALPRSMILCQ